jgi:hypothetical protein
MHTSPHAMHIYTASIINKHGNDGMIVYNRKRRDSGDVDSTAIGSIGRWNTAHVDIGMLVKFDTTGGLLRKRIRNVEVGRDGDEDDMAVFNPLKEGEVANTNVAATTGGH